MFRAGRIDPSHTMTEPTKALLEPLRNTWIAADRRWLQEDLQLLAQRRMDPPTAERVGVERRELKDPLQCLLASGLLDSVGKAAPPHS